MAREKEIDLLKYPGTKKLEKDSDRETRNKQAQNEKMMNQMVRRRLKREEEAVALAGLGRLVCRTIVVAWNLSKFIA